MPRPSSSVRIVRAEERFRTSTTWSDAWYSFSFGPHYDPANTHHGCLLIHNDETLAPGTGFDLHPHRDNEIITWVLEGSLVHRDTSGNTGIIRPGQVQRLSAGSGIEHSERNDPAPGSTDLPSAHVRFLQMTVTPTSTGGTPDYAQADVSTALEGGTWVVLASGMAEHQRTAAVTLGNTHAALHAVRPGAGTSLELPSAPWIHLHVARGTVTFRGGAVADDSGGAASGGDRLGGELSGEPSGGEIELRAGDSVRLTGAGGGFTAGEDGAEVLVWEMHAGLWG